MMARDDSLRYIRRSRRHCRINPSHSSHCYTLRDFLKYNEEKKLEEAIKALKNDEILPFAAICQKEVARVWRGDRQALIKTNKETAARVFYNLRAVIVVVVSDLLAANASVSPDLLASASIGEEAGAGGDMQRPDFKRDLAFCTTEEVLAGDQSAAPDGDVAARVSPYLLAPGSMGEEVLADGAGGDQPATASLADDEVPVDGLPNLLPPGPMGDEVFANGTGDDMRAAFKVEEVSADGAGAALFDREFAARVSPYLLAPGSMGEEVLADGAGGDLPATAALSDDEVPFDDVANLPALGPMGDEVLPDGAGEDMRARINVHVLAGDAGGSKRAAFKVEVHGGNADGDILASFEVYDEEAATGVLRGGLRIDLYDKEKNGHKSARKLPARELRAVHYILVICLLVAKLVMIGLILAGYFVRSPPLD